MGNGKVYLGRRQERPGSDWALSIGRAVDRKNEEVLLDSSSPHVIFVCGARGSGKSYTLGVLAEELAESNSDIAAAIVDPIGIFWSMRYANREEDEIDLLKEMGAGPHGFEKVQVFVPTGYKSEIPDETFDSDFSFRPNSLRTEDWCLTFGVDRYSPQALLLERATEMVKGGYTRRFGDDIEGGTGEVPPRENFSIDDLLDCINHGQELLSKEKGFRGSTRRALSSRLGAAKEWGIFGKRKKMSDFISSGKISVIDISFLPENIGSLVLGILSRKILAARKASAREEAVKDLRGEEGSRSGSIPPTWLMIDEAQSFAPSSEKTAATDPLVEYVKQGRRPGLTAVLSTQQPSALNSKIISQLDILISHRLTFENDIKEVRKRMPTTLPDDLREPEPLKELSEGTAIVADREMSWAFVTSIRPRFSQHEGRERVTETPDEEVGSKDRGKFEGTETQPGIRKEPEVAQEFPKRGEEILAIPFQVELDKALELLESERKRTLAILWISEEVGEVSKHYYPIWSALVDHYPTRSEPINLEIKIDALTGELVLTGWGGLIRSEGVRKLPDLGRAERNILFEVLENSRVNYDSLEDIAEGGRGKLPLDGLLEMGLVEEGEEGGNIYLEVGENVFVPPDLSDEPLIVDEESPDTDLIPVPADSKVGRVISEERMLETLEAFGEIEIINRELYYHPYWTGELVGDGEKRIVAVDGVSGLRDKYAEKMLRRRI